MLTRRFVLCIIALALLLGAYVGYQFYESRVESDELISRPDAIQPNVAEGTELSEDADLRKPSPKADTVDLPPPKLVAGQMAYILPDGKQIPFRIPEGMEDSKVMIFPPGTFPELEDKVEPPKLASVRYHIDDIPEGETIETYGMKLSIAQGRGISIEEVEKKMANGEIMMMSPTEHMEYLKSLGANAQVLAEIERRSLDVDAQVLADRLRRNLEKRDGRESRRSTKPPPSGNRKQPQGKAQ